MLNLSGLIGRFYRPKKRKADTAKPLEYAGLYARGAGADAWWPLSEDMELSTDKSLLEPNEPGVYLSFAPTTDDPNRDYAILVDKSERVLVQDLMSDVGEKIFLRKMQFGDLAQHDMPVAKRLKTPWLYATRQDRIESLPEGVQLVSGQALLRGLLAQTEQIDGIETPFVTGMLFPGEVSQVLILMVCHESGELTNLEYLPLGGTDPSTAISNYVKEVRLSSSGEWSNERTAVFASQEAQGLAVKAYPSEAEFFGLPESKLWKSGGVLCGAALACTAVATAGVTYLNYDAKQSSAAKVMHVKAQQVEVEKSLASERLGSLLERKAIDVDKTLSRASAVWQEGALVSIKATKDLLTLTVLHKVQTPEQSPRMLAKALSIPAPEGCTRMPPTTTSQLTELYLTYECQTLDPDLQRLGSGPR